MNSIEVSWEQYAQAERFLPSNAERLAFLLTVDPVWNEGGSAFWYRANRRDRIEYQLFDRQYGKRPLFDHERLAAGLSRTTGTPFDAENLDLDEPEYDFDRTTLSFSTADRHWQCDLTTYDCTSSPLPAPPDGTAIPSPDGRQKAFARDNNLWLGSIPDGSEHALTTDGAPDLAFGAPLASPLTAAGLQDPESAIAFWSPNNEKILTVRIDSRESSRFHLVQSLPPDGSTRPWLHSYVYPLPGDNNIPTFEFWIVDPETGSQIKAKLDPLPMLYYGSPLHAETIWWNDDASEVFVLTRDRGFLSYRLFGISTIDGTAREIVTETSETGIEPFLYWAAFNIRVIRNSSEVVWFSNRDGWAHLYLYDARTGELLRQITSGTSNVAEIVQIDERERFVYYTVIGDGNETPYLARLYRVSLDGGTPELLTPELAHHSISMKPRGTLIVDTYSTIEQRPVTVVRDLEGSILAMLESADIQSLTEMGWVPPARFVAKGRDGRTDIHGVFFRPTNFDPGAMYPVIDNIYGGPQVNQTPTSFADSRRFGGAHRAGRGRGFWHAQAIAELGFIVVMIDGMGMPGRSKHFLDVSYKRLADGGLPDHILAIRQLADRYSFLDLSRVGIFGHSAGGYASVQAILSYPDFYKVCVSSAGNHDHRLDKAGWVERYMGYPTAEHYDEQANRASAAGLQGKLLLIHGEMDENVHPSSTIALVNALIKENKDFDLLIMPNTPHFCDADPYFVRKRWDYFVRHLRGSEPPAGYRITA